MSRGARVDHAIAIVFATGLTCTLVGCASSHTSRRDSSVDVTDADEITADDRAVIDYVTAACEAWAQCPSGVLYAEAPYLHGPAQCMREWGDLWIEEIRAGLRRGEMEIDHREHARCMAVYETGRCPAVLLQTHYWVSQCWLGNAFPWRGSDLGARCGGDTCGLAGSCVGPAECRTCVPTPEVGEPCRYRGPPCRPGSVCRDDRCVLEPTREVGEGEPCGLTAEEVGVNHLCAPGLYCDEDVDRPWNHRCRAVPRLGEPCDDGLCAPGTVCVPGEWSNVCSTVPLREGQLCDSDSHESDACDHVNGLVCGDGICVRAGRGLGEPCILSCDEGLGCSGRQRCEPFVPLPYNLPNGAPCEGSDQCVSRWCDDQSGPRVCRPSDTACE